MGARNHGRRNPCAFRSYFPARRHHDPFSAERASCEDRSGRSVFLVSLDRRRLQRGPWRPSGRVTHLLDRPLSIRFGAASTTRRPGLGHTRAGRRMLPHNVVRNSASLGLRGRMTFGVVGIETANPTSRSASAATATAGRFVRWLPLRRTRSSPARSRQEIRSFASRPGGSR